ncbi:hypothetical protein Pfo_005644 [Paulownia fortunei]|nr:hypothetical protein Pfo_005644 [Paulownia fortunei]
MSFALLPLTLRSSSSTVNRGAGIDDRISSDSCSTLVIEEGGVLARSNVSTDVTRRIQKSFSVKIR